MAFLPTPGSPDIWGTLLNTWLLTGHAADGTHSGLVVPSGGLTVTAGGLTLGAADITLTGNQGLIGGNAFYMTTQATPTLLQVGSAGGWTSGISFVPGGAAGVMTLTTSGLLTVANGLTVTAGGATISAGGLTVSAGVLAAPTAVFAGKPWFDITHPNYGAKCDGQVVTDGNMANGSAVLTSASGKFVSGDVGKIIAVGGASTSAPTFNVLGSTILSYQSATQVTLNTPATQATGLNTATVTWGTNDSPAWKAAIAAAALVASKNSPATILLPAGRSLVGQSNTDYIDLSTLAATDYIDIVGTDQFASIIDRPYSLGVGNAVIQCGDHCRLANFTIQSKTSRLIHWDTGQGALLIVDGLYMPAGGGGNGVSTGIASGNSPASTVSRLIVQNCILGDGGAGGANVTCHNGGAGDGASAMVYIMNNKWSQTAGAAMSIDLTAGTGNVILYAYANAVNWWEVDDSASLLFKVADANAAYANVYTDGSVRMERTAIGANLKFWNYIHYTTQLNHSLWTTGNTTSEAAVMVYDPVNDNLKQTTTKTDLFPVIIACQRGGLGSISTNYVPILCTGAYAEVTCDAVAIALNDIIVSSATAQQATVDNTATDPRRILGWAVQTKGAVSGRVRIRRNQSVGY